MKQVIVFGECMVELFQQADQLYQQSFAGDVYNTAVYCKRSAPQQLNLKFLSAVGTDVVSDKLLARLDQEKLDSSLVLRTQGAGPGLYMINTDANGERSFVYWRDSSAARQSLTLFRQHSSVADLLPVDLFYFSGISLAILSSEDRRYLFALIEQLKTQGVQIAFDPNYRAALWPEPEMCRLNFEQAYRLADIALPGLDDHQVLYDSQSTADVVAQLQQLGVKEIVVKNAADGVLLYSEGQSQHCAAVQVKKVTDTTAAGDSFNGGYLASRLLGASALASCQYAAALAAFVVEHTGAIVSEEQFNSFAGSVKFPWQDNSQRREQV
jgi:2-dehydro-3-deoxygluconokinase